MALTMRIPLCCYPLPVAYNAGLALLSALLKEHDLDTSLCLLSEPGAFDREVLCGDVPCVCFSAVTQADYEASVPFMRAAAEAGKLVVLGGTWASLGRDADPSVTAVCRGDGESLPGFILRGNCGLFETRMVCADLNALPLPDYELFDGIPFDRGLPAAAGNYVLPYLSSRGCPFSCRFCQVRLQTPGVRIRTRVEDDLRILAHRYAPDLFFIGDALVPYYSRAWRASWGEFRHPFFAYIRADIPPEPLEWLLARGMVGCGFGVESGDESYRNDVLGKELSDAALWRTVKRLDAAGVWYVPFFMDETPGETFRQRTATAKLAREMGPHSMVWRYEELGTWDSPPLSL